MTDDETWRDEADEVYRELLERIGEGDPQRRLAATRRAAELLGDPQRAYPVIHITGTNGKTSTARIIDSILRAYGLKTGLLTSPHLMRFTERIRIDGEPITDEAVVRNYEDIAPYLAMTDAELEAADEPPLTFFEALTVLAFAAFADAPVDVVVLEVGIGGEWDSTNVADGQVAVFSPIDLDHVGRLGDTIAEIARTKSGIIKPAAAVVSARQQPDALRELQRAVELTESTFAVEGDQFDVVDARVAVGGQLVSIRGTAGTYTDLFLPLHGEHQAHNAAIAVAAVEEFIGGGEQPLTEELLTEGFATVTSPGRLHLVGVEPSVLVDAAHNPHGASALVAALGTSFDFDEVAIVVGILTDKDAEGIVAALAPAAARFIVTQSASDRAIRADRLADDIRDQLPEADVVAFESLDDAIAEARGWAEDAPRRAVLVTGSITLVGDVMTIAEADDWMHP